MSQRQWLVHGLRLNGDNIDEVSAVAAAAHTNGFFPCLWRYWYFSATDKFRIGQSISATPPWAFLCPCTSSMGSPKLSVLQHNWNTVILYASAECLWLRRRHEFEYYFMLCTKPSYLSCHRPIIFIQLTCFYDWRCGILLEESGTAWMGGECKVIGGGCRRGQ